MTKSGKGYLDQVNATKISPKLLAELLCRLADMPVQDRHVPEARMVQLFELLKAKGLKGKRHADTAVAVDLRLMALVRLIQNHDVRAWRLPADDGATFVHVDLLQAAADEPMIETGDRQAGFEPEQFRARVLELTQVRGTA